MTTRWARVPGFLVCAVLLVACDPANERPALSDAAKTAVVRAGDGGTVDMREVAPFDWDSMYAFSSYQRDEDVSATLGFPWGNGDNMRLESDSMVLLAFVKGKEVVGWDILNDFDTTGPSVDFADNLYSTAIPRQSALFRAKLSAQTTTGGYDGYTLSLLP